MGPTLEGLFRVSFGFHLGLLGFLPRFNKIVLSRFSSGSCQIEVLGFRVLCSGNKSRQPSCHVHRHTNRQKTLALRS